MTDYSRFNNYELMKELKHYISKGYIDKNLIPEIEKRLIVQEKKDELITLYKKLVRAERKCTKCYSVYRSWNSPLLKSDYIKALKVVKNLKRKIKILEEVTQ